MSSQPLSVGVSSSVAMTGQLAGLLRPVTAAGRSVHIGGVPSTLSGVQFISKPVQILQTSANSATQLLSAVPTASQVGAVLKVIPHNIFHHAVKSSVSDGDAV